MAALALAALQLVVLVSLAVAGPDSDPHRAPLAIVAPPVVAKVLVDQMDAGPGRPIDAGALSTAADARAGVRDGRVVAAVVVDLAADGDILYVTSARGMGLVTAVRRPVAAAESPFGRSTTVRDLVPARDGDRGARGVFAIVGVAVLLGFIVPIVITWLRGPVARTFALGSLRVIIVVAVSILLGLVAAVAGSARYDGGPGTWWLIGTLAVLAVATTTMALESVFGVLGIGLASTLFVLLGAPLVRLTDPLLLPQPWATITPWMPIGAALDAATGQAYFEGPDRRPLLVLTTWIVLAVLVMVIARRERVRDGVTV